MTGQLQEARLVGFQSRQIEELASQSAVEILTTAEEDAIRGEILGNAKDGLSHVDLDRTTIGYPGGEYTDSGIHDAVKALTARHHVSISTVRPLGHAIRHHDDLGFHEPVLVENGGVAAFPKRSIEVIFDEPGFAHAAAMREFIERTLVNQLMAEGFSLDYYALADRELEAYLAAQRDNSHWDNPSARNVLMVNLDRKLGLTVWAGGKPQDPTHNLQHGAFHDATLALMEEFDRANFKTPFVYRPTEEIPAIIALGTATTKSTVWKELIDFLGIENVRGLDLYQFGDGKDDVIELPPGYPQVRLLAPRNAVEIAQKRATIVANGIVTEGLVELIGAVLNNDPRLRSY